MTTNATTLANRGSSSRKALMIALAFATMSALLVFYYVSKSSGGGSVVTTAPVLVAAQNIGLGQAITTDNVTIKALPVQAKHPLAVVDKTKAVGQVATEPLTAGQQILSTEITTNRDQLGLVSSIPAGERAFTISASEVSANGGFVKPGDHVDVLGTFDSNVPITPGDVVIQPKGGNSQQQIITTTVLQNVEVLAVGQSGIQPQQQQNTGSVSSSTINPSANQADAKSVTLALTPDEAQKVFLADQTGTLRLALRPAGDNAPIAIQPQNNSLRTLPAPANP